MRARKSKAETTARTGAAASQDCSASTLEKNSPRWVPRCPSGERTNCATVSATAALGETSQCGSTIRASWYSAHRSPEGPSTRL